MPNITLSIPEDLLKNGRKYAQRRGTSLNGLVRDLLAETVFKPTRAVDSMVDRLRQSTGDSKGIRIKREDLHRH
jgi:hypothetical protein